MTQDNAALELQYHQIAELYELAEDLVATVEHSSIKQPEEQLTLVEPLVNQLGESTDILCEEFIEVAGKRRRGAARKSRIEAALRKIYTAVDHYTDQVRVSASQAASGIRNIADPIVEKIKHQVEFVISILVDYINLSLDRIMQKQHIEELRRRQEKIAQMLMAADKNRGMELGA